MNTILAEKSDQPRDGATLRLATDRAPAPHAPRPELPMVLHVRVVSGAGGGPDKTILRSPRYVDNTFIRMAAAYIHPRRDPGIEVIREHAQRMGCPLWTIGESGPLDPRTVRSLYQLCRKLRVTVWHGHDYKSNALGLLLRRFWKMKLVTTVHGWTHDTLRTKLYYHVDNLCLPRYDQIITVSPKLTRHCLRRGIPADRVTYIANGIDTGEFQRTRDMPEARRQLGVDPDAFVIGVVGRLSREKGVDRAIRTVAALRGRYPKVQLHLIGDGPEFENLRQLSRDLHVTANVQFWGWQPDARRFYEAMDTLLLPSHTEGAPNVVLEAMAMGVPVAATNVGSVRELLKGGRRGVILDRRDNASWPDHLAPLLVSSDRRAELARQGRRRVEKYYSFAVRMEKVFNVYDRVLTIAPDREPMAWRRAA